MTLYAIVKFLKSQPNCVGSYDEVKTLVGESDYLSMKKFYKHPDVLRCLKLNMKMAYKDLYPDSNPKQWTSKNNSTVHVRVMTLAHLDIVLLALLLHMGLVHGDQAGVAHLLVTEIICHYHY